MNDKCLNCGLDPKRMPVKYLIVWHENGKTIRENYCEDDEDKQSLPRQIIASLYVALVNERWMITHCKKALKEEGILPPYIEFIWV